MTEKHDFSTGERVRIKVGPFQSFPARIVEVDTQKRTLKVKIDIFGRAHPLELAFTDVEGPIENRTPPTRFNPN